MAHSPPLVTLRVKSHAGSRQRPELGSRNVFPLSGLDLNKVRDLESSGAQ